MTNKDCIINMKLKKTLLFIYNHSNPIFKKTLPLKINKLTQPTKGKYSPVNSVYITILMIILHLHTGFLFISTNIPLNAKLPNKAYKMRQTI